MKNKTLIYLAKTLQEQNILIDWDSNSIEENILLNYKKLNWKKISEEYALSDDMIEDLKDMLNWHIFSYNNWYSFSSRDDFLLKYKEYLYWEDLLRLFVIKEQTIQTLGFKYARVVLPKLKDKIIITDIGSLLKTPKEKTFFNYKAEIEDPV